MKEANRAKIKSRLDELEANFKAEKHLLEHASDGKIIECYQLVESISKFRCIFIDEEKDFSQVARIALLEQHEWN